jgi:hypothetical protein
MTKPDAIEALAVLTAAYNREIPEQTLRIYVKALEDLDRDSLLGATTDLMVTSKFFPTVAELRHRAVEISAGGELPPSAYAAWGEVLTAASSQGRDHRPVWSSPAIGAALDQIGGYRRVCDSELIGVERSHFLKAYDVLVERTLREAQIPAALRGSLQQIGRGGDHHALDNADDDSGD